MAVGILQFPKMVPMERSAPIAATVFLVLLGLAATAEQDIQ